MKRPDDDPRHDTAHELRPTERLPAIDAARGLALIGMVLAHYAQSATSAEPGALRALENVADGRAAPLFCVILGIGAGLLIGRAGRAALFRRAIVVFLIGLALWPLTDRVYLILPHYGVLLAIVIACARLSDRQLLGAAGIAWIVPSAIVAVVDGHGLRAADEPQTYTDLVEGGVIAYQLGWGGGYPVIGWIGFAFVGMWLSRRRLTDRSFQVGLVSAGLAIALLQLAMALLFNAVGGVAQTNRARGAATFLDTTAHSNQTGWYVIATGSALAVIGLCSLAGRSTLMKPFALLGRHALTLYITHLLIGIWLVWPWVDGEEPPLIAQFAVAGTVVTSFAVASWAWSTVFDRGPAEAVVRLVSGSSGRRSRKAGDIRAGDD